MSAARDAIPSMIDRIRHDLVGLKMPRENEDIGSVAASCNPRPLLQAQQCLSGVVVDAGRANPPPTAC